MKIIKPGFEFITPIDGSVILKRLEECGRVCYKSEGKITDDSAPKFIAGIIGKCTDFFCNYSESFSGLARTCSFD